jgi:hypothetical protein
VSRAPVNVVKPSFFPKSWIAENYFLAVSPSNKIKATAIKKQVFVKLNKT